jgi:hypothetical protein
LKALKDGWDWRECQGEKEDSLIPQTLEISNFKQARPKCRVQAFEPALGTIFPNAPTTIAESA